MEFRFSRTETLTAQQLCYALQVVIDNSRFRATAEVVSNTRHRMVKLGSVRLRSAKEYCGNHPNACEVGGPERHRKTNLLEGADWVEVNDMVNDLLDRLGLAADVKTTLLVLRKGRRRRTHYGSYVQRVRANGARDREWNQDEADEHYADYCGQSAPDSTFPPGTPGQYRQQYFVIG